MLDIIVNKQLRKLMAVRISEIFEDGDIAAFDELIAQKDVTELEILNSSDHDLRTPLHMVCKKGYLDFFDKLLPLYIKHKINLDSIDENGDTPLLLASSHCYEDSFDFTAPIEENPEQAKKIEEIQERRFTIVSKLLEAGADIKKAIGERKNNPLHWAIYYGDYKTGMELFNHYPLIILRKNNDKYIPLEILFHKKLIKKLAKKSKVLVREICKQFATGLFENNDGFILNNADKEERKKFSKIKKLRQRSSAYDTVKMLSRVADIKKMKNLRKSVLEKKSDKIVMEEEGEKKGGNMFKKLVAKQKQTQVKPVSNELGESIPLNDSMLSDDREAKSVFMKIYDESQKKILKNKYLKLLHKMLIIAVHIDDLNIIKLLMDNFMLSPFVKTIKKITAMHYACYLGNERIVRFFLNVHYTYFNSKRKFDLLKVINEGVTDEFNNCAHFACQSTNKEVFELLVDKGVNLTQFNFQDWMPFDFSKKSYFLEREKFLLNKIENEDLLKFDDIMKVDNWNPEKLNVVKEDFMFVIVARDTESDYQKTLVYQQLSLLSKTYKQMIDIKYIKPLVDTVTKFHRFYFLLNVQEELLDSIADYLNFNIFNMRKGYVTTFDKKRAKEFNKFRDFHIHAILSFLLNREFNLNHYIKQGIIEGLFPLHEFRTRNNIYRNWKKERLTVFFDPWKPKRSTKDLRPFNSLAFYFGCDISLYISFTVLYSSFLIFLGVIGLGFFVYTLYIGDDFDNYLTPLYAFLVSIWVTITYEKWRQREKEHAFIWNTLDYKQNEVPRIDYLGNYVIDPVYKNVTKKDFFPTPKRRMIVG